MKYETIDSDQINDIMEGRDPRPPAGWDDSSDSDSSGGASAEEGEDAGSDAPIGGPAGQH
jgi:cell division protease FtsH